MEDTAQISTNPTITPHRQSRIKKWSVSERTQESNCVEQVRLSDSISPSDTREWAETDIDSF